MKMTGWLNVGLLGTALYLMLVPAQADDFSDPAAWAVFDAASVGAIDGYMMPSTDGRYVYFTPSGETADRGEILRLDTAAAFDDPAAWQTFHPRANGVGSDPEGFVGSLYDGRYVYFVPYRDGPRYHAEVLRYDTQGAFDNPVAWAAYTPTGAIGGYQGGAYDGRYVYFVPHRTGSVHNQVMRYDTQGSFDNDASWSLFQPSGAVGGYTGATFDGQFVYFAPTVTMGADRRRVLRYDTALPFDDQGSWTVFNVPAVGGYSGTVAVGDYVYFFPSDNNYTQHGEVLRYDRNGGFTDPAAWSTFDYGAVCGDCNDPDGYWGGCTDGRYIYFAPGHNGTAYHAEVLRYDTMGAFDAVSSWSTFDAAANIPPGASGGYFGAVSVGGSIYFSPFVNDSGLHSEVLAFGTKLCVPGPELLQNGDFELGNCCFITEYTYVTDDLQFNTTYALTDNPNPLHWMNLCDFGDHTSGAGLMMALNGAEQLGIVAWSQVVPVNPQSDYTFSLAMANWSYATPAHVRVFINGTEVTAWDAPVACGVWEERSVMWSAGTATQAEIVLVSDPDGGADYALDDLSFRTHCDPDCNGNGVSDYVDLAECLGDPWCSDCNGNGTLDECDLLECDGSPWCGDCNGNGVPDGCEPDCDGDGLIDDCDPDMDDDGVPNEQDVCDYTPVGAPVELDGSLRGDLDGDCDVDIDDFGILQSRFTGSGCGYAG